MSIASYLRKKVVDLSGKGYWGHTLYYLIKYNAAQCLGFLMGERRYAKWFYHLYTGKKLNLDNPQYFDEKLWWLKLNNRDPNLTRCSDKYEVRSYVKENGLEDILIPQFDVFDSIKDINLNKYTCECIVKCTHNSGGHLFYDPLNPLSENELKRKKYDLNYILHHNAYVLSREWNYKNIKPRIIVEKVIRDKNGNLPLDYKFMCFNGEPKLLFLDLGVINKDKSYNHDYPRNIYDMNFNLLPVKETRPNADFKVEKPEHFEYMVEIARKLSKPFVHCRVDLYNVDGKIYFGEITFYHGGGCNNIQPKEWDKRMGDWIDLNSPKIVLNK